jgi:hypothetical protein
MTIVQPNYAAPLFAMTPRALSDITDLIVHHSDGPWAQTALEIDAEHRALNPPDAMIAYNYVVGHDGTVWAGRALDVVPAAAFGRNLESVNVCLTGDFQPNTPGFCGKPTAEQMQSLKGLAVYLHRMLPTIVRTIGHRDVAPLFYPTNQGDYSTACPGQNLYDLLGDVKAYVRSQMPGL